MGTPTPLPTRFPPRRRPAALRAALRFWAALALSTRLLAQDPSPADDFGASLLDPEPPHAAQPPPPPPPPQGALSVLKQLDAALSALYEFASPSVVVVRVDKADEDGGAFDTAQDTDGLGLLLNEGSGIILDKTGHIVTNLHVIEGAKNIRVRLKDGREFPATRVGADDKTDIAVIRVNASGLVPARFGDSDRVRVGQLAAVIGAPYNLHYSFTVGVVSGLNRSNLNVAAFEDYIQTDASINPGNSGGPLLDSEGRVIGMATLVNGINRGLGFAIPSNMLLEVAAQLAEKGRIRRPWLGIGLDDDSTTLSGRLTTPPGGVIVRSIAIGSPAYGSGIRAGDLITAVEGKPVSTIREVQKIVLAKNIGDPVTLTLSRKGKTLTVTIKTAELPGSNLIETTPGGGPGPDTIPEASPPPAIRQEPAPRRSPAQPQRTSANPSSRPNPVFL